MQKLLSINEIQCGLKCVRKIAHVYTAICNTYAHKGLLRKTTFIFLTSFYLSSWEKLLFSEQNKIDKHTIYSMQKESTKSLCKRKMSSNNYVWISPNSERDSELILANVYVCHRQNTLSQMISNEFTEAIFWRVFKCGENFVYVLFGGFGTMIRKSIPEF